MVAAVMAILASGSAGSAVLVERDQLLLERRGGQQNGFRPRARASRSAVASRSASSSGALRCAEPDRGQLGGQRPGVFPLVQAQRREQRIDVDDLGVGELASISRRHSPSSSPPSSVSARAAGAHRRRGRPSRAAGVRRVALIATGCPGKADGSGGRSSSSAARSRARRCRRRARRAARSTSGRAARRRPGRGRAARGARPRAGPRGPASPRGSRGAAGAPRRRAAVELVDPRARAARGRLRAPVSGSRGRRRRSPA